MKQRSVVGGCGCVPIDAAKLAAMYPSRDSYVSQVKEAPEKALKAGYILRPDADATIAAANRSSVEEK